MAAALRDTRAQDTARAPQHAPRCCAFKSEKDDAAAYSSGMIARIRDMRAMIRAARERGARVTARAMMLPRAR